MTTCNLDRAGVCLAVSLFTLFAAACSATAPVTIEPIERQTEQLFGQVQFELQLDELILLNSYVDQESPRVKDFEEARSELTAAAELLVDYSISVIDVARFDTKQAGVEALVPLLRRFHADLTALPYFRERLGGVDIDAITGAMAAQRDLTSALGAAAAMHEAAAVAVRSLVDETRDRFDRAYDETYDKIVAEYASFTEYTDSLVKRRNDVLDRLLLLDAARLGDSDSWRLLFSGDNGLARRLGDAPEMSDTVADEAEAELVSRLAHLAEIWGYLEPSWRSYQATLKELHAVEAKVLKVLQLASYIIESWDDAQRQLATGRSAGFVAVTKDLAYLVLKRATR